MKPASGDSSPTSTLSGWNPLLLSVGTLDDGRLGVNAEVVGQPASSARPSLEAEIVSVYFAVGRLEYL